MKKWLMMILTMLLPLCAQAEELPAQLTALLQGAHPGFVVSACDQWGDTAAAVMEKDEERMLCVAEKWDGQWLLVVDNPNALRRGETPELFLDADTALFWRYREGENLYTEYSAFRGSDGWGPVSCLVRETFSNGYTEEAQHTWREDGSLWRTNSMVDENDNIVMASDAAPVPAAWLEKYIRLADYHDGIFPKPNLYDTCGWLDHDAMEKCAQQLAPACLFLGGEANEDGLELFVRKQDGDMVLLGCLLKEDGWQITESAVLPDNTGYGWENFSDCLVLEGKLLASVRPMADGTWSVGYTCPVTEGEMIRVGAGWIAGEDGRRMYGSHPWGDMTRMDWSALPMSLEQAKKALNTDGWAVVNNPNPADRLHLRVKADKGAKSLGKYYSGTIVKVLDRKGDWTQVEVLGVQGWMMTKYLAFGQDMDKVEAAIPQLTVKEGVRALLYTSPREDAAAIREAPAGMEVLGLAGDAWYHVWNPDTGESGYMRQEDFWAGNG